MSPPRRDPSTSRLVTQLPAGLAASAAMLRRRWEPLALLLALPASWAVPRLLGVSPSGRVGPTLAMLPLVVAGLATLERAALRRGARPASAWLRGAQAVALLGSLALVAARSRIGVPVPAPIVATGLFVLLAWYLGTLLPRLRPLLGERLPARPSLVFFWLPFLVYVAVLPWCTGERPPDGDEPYFLLVTHSLAYDLDADLADNYRREDSLAFMPRALEPQPGDPVGRAGERWSRHNLLLPLVLAAPYRVAGPRGAFAAMAAIAAALAWATLRLARHQFASQPGAALLAWALLAFAPPLLLYSHQVWAEVPAALLVVLALDALPMLGRRHGQVVFWSAIALLPLLKMRFALFALLLVGMALLRRRGRREAMVGAVALAALLAGILLFNQSRFGNALKTGRFGGVATQGGDVLLRGFNQHLQAEPLPDLAARALGLFFDVGFGLFACAPLWALLLLALPLLARRGGSLRWDLLVLGGPYLVLLALRREWFGGWSPPFRYGMVLLPLLALALVPLLADRRRGGARLVLAALAAPTLALTLLWLAVPGWTYNHADGGNHLLDLLSRELRLDLQRFFPSGTLPRAATWWWPPLALLALGALWRRPRRFHPALPALGVAAALLAPAFAALAAARLPTRVIELEDPQVVASGGDLFPGLWTFDRLRFPAGWRMQEGVRVEAPVVAGGERVELTLVMQRPRRSPREGVLVIAAGERELARVSTPRRPPWRAHRVGPLDWPAGEPLVLTLEPVPGWRGRPALVSVDRVELRWR